MICKVGLETLTPTSHEAGDVVIVESVDALQVPA